MCQEVKSKVMGNSTSETWYREPQWQDHIAAFPASGMDVKEYCEANNLKLFQFIYWQRKLSERMAVV